MEENIQYTSVVKHSVYVYVIYLYAHYCGDADVDEWSYHPKTKRS